MLLSSTPAPKATDIISFCWSDIEGSPLAMSDSDIETATVSVLVGSGIGDKDGAALNVGLLLGIRVGAREGARLKVGLGVGVGEGIAVGAYDGSELIDGAGVGQRLSSNALQLRSVSLVHDKAPQQEDSPIGQVLQEVLVRSAG